MTNTLTETARFYRSAVCALLLGLAAEVLWVTALHFVPSTPDALFVAVVYAICIAAGFFSVGPLRETYATPMVWLSRLMWSLLIGEICCMSGFALAVLATGFDADLFFAHMPFAVQIRLATGMIAGMIGGAIGVLAHAKRPVLQPR